MPPYLPSCSHIDPRWEGLYLVLLPNSLEFTWTGICLGEGEKQLILMPVNMVYSYSRDCTVLFEEGV